MKSNNGCIPATSQYYKTHENLGQAERAAYFAQDYHGEPIFISEYGGIRWIKNATEGWGYGNAPQTEQEFFDRYKGLIEAMLKNIEIFGFCYTQLYDIEQEI